MEKSTLPLYEVSRPISRTRRLLAILLFFIAMVQIYTTFMRGVLNTNNTASEEANIDMSPCHSNDLDVCHQRSWSRLSKILEKSKPQISTALQAEAVVPSIPISQSGLRREIDAVRVNTTLIGKIGDAHSSFEEYVLNNQATRSGVYRSDQRGIVTTGSRQDLATIMLLLKMLRRTESNLPVDVFLLKREDYDVGICEGPFIKLKARCRILSDLMSNKTLPVVDIIGTNKAANRQLTPNEPLHKLLALFFSDFEDNLLLDPNTLPFNEPDSIFKQEPYLSKGLIMWPDFWTSSISPRLSLIQRQTVIDRLQSDRTSTVDLSQMMLSKSLHSDTLLLAIYYTCYGPNLYDVMLQQSNDGEEKGTQAIKAAARQLNNRFYMVKNQRQTIGYPQPYTFSRGKDAELRRKMRVVATLQHFAVEDYHRRPLDQHRPAFIHAINSTFNPLHPLQLESMPSTSLLSKYKTKNRSRVGNRPERYSTTSFRMWQIFSARHASNGWDDSDPEHALWEEMANVACKDLQQVPSYTSKAQEACRKIQRHLDRFESAV